MAELVEPASVTSHAIATAPGPAALAVSSSRSRRRASSATRAPRWARPIPMQRPSPLDAPTTTALTAAPFAPWRSPSKHPTQEPALDDRRGRIDRAVGRLAHTERVDEGQQDDRVRVGVAE